MRKIFLAMAFVIALLIAFAVLVPMAFAMPESPNPATAIKTASADVALPAVDVLLVALPPPSSATPASVFKTVALSQNLYFQTNRALALAVGRTRLNLNLNCFNV